MRILFVAPYIPSTIRVRPYQWIRALARRGHRVRLVALRPPEDAWVDGVPVADYCEHVTVVTLSRARTLLNALRAIPAGLPLQAAYSSHGTAERIVASEATRCDVVHVEHLRGAVLARRITGVPCVLDAVDSISALFQDAVRSAAHWRQRSLARIDLERTRRFEAGLPRRFDWTVVSSSRDAMQFRRLAGAAAADRIAAVPNGVDLAYFSPGPAVEAAAETVLFTGKMSYHANEAAALRLGRLIMPIIWERRPQARLVIAGKDPSAAIRQLARDPRISVPGFVDDFRPLFAAASVVVAPLVYAAGIQNKILEAMACAVPVVASPAAFDGLRAEPSRDLLVGRDDREIAAATLALMNDASLRHEIGCAGRRFVTKYHDWNEMCGRLTDVYELACSSRRCA